MTDCLYRGLNKDEVTGGYQLIPKGIETFELFFARANAASLVELDKHLNKGAVLRHHNGLPTSGVSTTPKIEVARYYATSGSAPSYHIARISRKKLKQFSIEEYSVNAILLKEMIRKPEDEEIILSKNSSLPLPREIIDEIYQITTKATAENKIHNRSTKGDSHLKGDGQ